jgi:hypothetical protein
MALAGYSMTAAGSRASNSDIGLVTVDQAASTNSRPAPAITSGFTSSLSGLDAKVPSADRSRMVNSFCHSSPQWGPA